MSQFIIVIIGQCPHGGERGHDRALLTLATGTGKTSIAFQIAWKLFGARWDLQEALRFSNNQINATEQT
jgi:hypothetical protein